MERVQGAVRERVRRRVEEPPHADLLPQAVRDLHDAHAHQVAVESQERYGLGEDFSTFRVTNGHIQCVAVAEEIDLRAVDLERRVHFEDARLPFAAGRADTHVRGELLRVPSVVRERVLVLEGVQPHRERCEIGVRIDPGPRGEGVIVGLHVHERLTLDEHALTDRPEQVAESYEDEHPDE